jgi:uncharacterized protein (DUF697 family)/tellurite resistance protein
MEAREQRALLAVALMAAFADGAKADAEREEIKRIAESLGAQQAGLNVGALVQEVLLKRISLAQAVADLVQPEYRQLAYELALGVCCADGAQSAAEMQFLANLKSALQVGSAGTAVEAQAGALAELTDQPGSTPTQAAAPPGAAAGAPPPQVVDNAALDRSILNQSILCGALELLPQSWASMAIIPLQVKLVYRIGQAHGVQLDQGHIKEFIATVGVGLTSQYLEQFGRKLLGGLLGKVAGGMGRGLGSAATGMAMSFASTYALGQLARRYYAGGRQMNTAVLQETYQSLLGNARQVQQQYLPQIEQRARTLDATQVLDLVRRPLA